MLETPNLAVGSLDRLLFAVESSPRRGEHEKKGKEGKSDDDDVGKREELAATAMEQGESANRPRRPRAAAEEARARLMVAFRGFCCLFCSSLCLCPCRERNE